MRELAMTVRVHSINRRKDDVTSREMVTYFGIDSSNSESRSIALKYDVIPAHTKTDTEPVAHPSESAIFMIKGRLMFYAKRKDGTLDSFEIKANDFIHVPAGEAHYAENLTSEPAEAIVAIPAPAFVN